MRAEMWGGLIRATEVVLLGKNEVKMRFPCHCPSHYKTLFPKDTLVALWLPDFLNLITLLIFL
jgi:hypothetical protein